MNGIQQIIKENGYNKCNCPNSSHVPDPMSIINNFIIEYYRNVSNVGWNSIMYLFDPNCTVICKDKKLGNAYDMLNAFSTEYIKRANYDSLRIKSVIIDNNNVLVNVFGNIQFVSFNGNKSKVFTFSESFILSSINGYVKCTQHIFDW